jgi:hypothetical protein
VPVIATIDIADVGARRAITAKGPPEAAQSHVGVCAALTPTFLPKPSPSRLAVLSLWDDLAQAAARPTADGDGFHAALEPVRLHGEWPGIPSDLPRSRAAQHEGAAVVLTLARLRWPRTFAFLKASAGAEAAVLDAPGMVWATGFAKPPFFATCSLWSSTEALAGYAYGGDRSTGHPDAIAVDRKRPFHRQSAFVRFRPVEAHGSLAGRNPLPHGAFTT